MTECCKIRPLLVLYADRALHEDERVRVEAHLHGCALCSAEAAQIQKIHGWLGDSALFEPSENLVWQLLPEKLAARAPSLESAVPAKFPFRAPKWALSAAALIVLTFGLVFFARYRTSPQLAGPAQVAAGNEAFVERMRTAYAREATTQYLTGCQDLLLDLMRADKTCAGDRYDVSLEIARARRLLQQKRVLEGDLQAPEIARAKGLCDQLEHFLVNLSMSSECETGDTMRDMESFIEEEQLLLRISLLQSGIS